MTWHKGKLDVPGMKPIPYEWRKGGWYYVVRCEEWLVYRAGKTLDDALKYVVEDIEIIAGVFRTWPRARRSDHYEYLQKKYRKYKED